MLILLSDDEQLQEEVGVQLRHVVRVLTERYINKDLFYFLQMKTIWKLSEMVCTIFSIHGILAIIVCPIFYWVIFFVFINKIILKN